MLLAAWFSLSKVERILEGRALDLRFSLAAKHPPDPRLITIALDDRALNEDSTPLAQWDGEFAELIEHILMGGARAVALDFLLSENFSRSLKFAKVIELHSDRVVLGMFSASGTVTGTECISPLTARILGEERYDALFGVVNLEEDEDRRIRRARPAFTDRDGRARLSFAARAAKTAAIEPPGFAAEDRDAWIDYTVSVGNIPNLSWNDASQRNPDFFRDKLVLIGADYKGSNDAYSIPPSASVPGMRIHAMIANTIAEGLPLRDLRLPACLTAMGMGCFAAIVLALRFPHRPSWAIACGVATFLGYALASILIFRTSRIVLAMVAPETALLLSAPMAWFLWSRLPMYPVKGDPT
jgi:CHASE2 domain-containing sensor protein